MNKLLEHVVKSLVVWPEHLSKIEVSKRGGWVLEVKYKYWYDDTSYASSRVFEQLGQCQRYMFRGHVTEEQFMEAKNATQV